MATISKFMYDGLSFKINSGYKTVIVNNTAIKVNSDVPSLTWTLDFGILSTESKNALENILYLQLNDIQIYSYVSPAYKISKRIDPVDDSVTYWLTYLFEYSYYGKPVNRLIPYVVEGLYHVIGGSIRIPIAQTAVDTPIQITTSVELPRKLFYLEETQALVHAFNGHYKFKARFKEQAGPIAYTNTFIVGESNVNYNSSC